MSAPKPWEMAATAGEEPPKRKPDPRPGTPRVPRRGAGRRDEGVPLAAGEVGAAVTPVLLPREVADLLRVPESTVRAMARDGRLRRIPNVGRRVLILTASVEEMVGGRCFTMAMMGQHGDGTITARRDGRLQVAVTMLDRRREFAYVPKSLVRRDPKAAARMAERLRDELLERRDAELEPGRQTLAAYLRSWLTSLEQAKRRKVRPRTLEHYRLIVEAHIIPALGAVRLDRLREPAVQRWLDGMDGSPRSIMHRRPSCATHTTWRSASASSSTTRPSRSSCPRTTGPAATRCRSTRPAGCSRHRGHAPGSPVAPGPRHRTAGGRAAGFGWTHLDPDARTVTLEAQLQRINRAWVRVPPKADRSLGRLAIMAETVDALEAHRRRQAAERDRSGRSGASSSSPRRASPTTAGRSCASSTPPVTPRASSGGASTTCAPRRPT
jgi:excisionase family DNA binding protein